MANMFSASFGTLPPDPNTPWSFPFLSPPILYLGRTHDAYCFVGLRAASFLSKSLQFCGLGGEDDV